MGSPQVSSLLSDMVSGISKYLVDNSQNPDTQFTMFLFPAIYCIRHFQHGTTDGSHRIIS